MPQIFSTQTDDTLLETLSHGSSAYPFAYYPDDIWQYDFHRVDWHWHPEVEFLSAVKGDIFLCAGAERFVLPEGRAVFINSGVLHRFEASDSTFSPNIVFSPTLFAPKGSLLFEKYVQPVLQSSLTFAVFDPQAGRQREIPEILLEIYRLQDPAFLQKQAAPQEHASPTMQTSHQEQGPLPIQKQPLPNEASLPEEKFSPNLPPHRELSTVRLLLELWELLTAHPGLSSDTAGMRSVGHHQARLQLMMQYIHDHYRERITLDEIAASASVSKSSALQIFQESIRLSPVSYLIQYRLSQAAALLNATKKPVSAVAEETGFAGAGYFCRRFKEHYHMSPGEYRQSRS